VGIEIGLELAVFGGKPQQFDLPPKLDSFFVLGGRVKENGMEKPKRVIHTSFIAGVVIGTFAVGISILMVLLAVWAGWLPPVFSSEPQSLIFEFDGMPIQQNFDEPIKVYMHCQVYGWIASSEGGDSNGVLCGPDGTFFIQSTMGFTVVPLFTYSGEAFRDTAEDGQRQTALIKIPAGEGAMLQIWEDSSDRVYPDYSIVFPMALEDVVFPIRYHQFTLNYNSSPAINEYRLTVYNGDFEGAMPLEQTELVYCLTACAVAQLATNGIGANGLETQVVEYRYYPLADAQNPVLIELYPGTYSLGNQPFVTQDLCAGWEQARNWAAFTGRQLTTHVLINYPGDMLHPPMRMSDLEGFLAAYENRTANPDGLIFNPALSLAITLRLNPRVTEEQLAERLIPCSDR
jgi:hypothetical protein